MTATQNLKDKTKLETQSQIVRNAWEQGYNDDQISKLTGLPIESINHLTEALMDEKKRRHEFRQWITPNIKAEFVDGEVIAHSPVKVKHWKVSSLLSRLMGTYVGLNNLGSVGYEKVMISLKRNDYEPDLVYYSKEKDIELDDEQVLCPPPDLAVEILSKSTATLDRGKKKRDYAAAGITEYWIVDPVKEIVEQYILFSSKDTVYAPAKILNTHHLLESKVIKGFSVPVEALFNEEENVLALRELMKV